MNIFAVYSCPIKSADYIWNDNTRRGIKMILESCQLLCTCIDYYGQKSIYKSTHKNHPCTLWVIEYEEGFNWVVRHCQRLIQIYENRYKKIHKCEEILIDCINKKELIKFKNKSFEFFINCARNKSLGLDFSNEKDVHLAYRNYLIARAINTSSLKK